MKANTRTGLGYALFAVGLFAAYAATAAYLGILSLPPYEDQAAGLWAEATYLIETDFDYQRLRTEEPQFVDGVGGRRSYLINLQPTLVALCLKATDSPKITAVAFRLHGYAWVVVIVISLHVLLRPHLGTYLALLPCLLVVATPLFQVQTEIGGMDLPMAGGAMMSLAALSRRSFGWAIFFSGVAFAMKATAAVLTMAIAMYLIARAVIGPRTKARRAERLGLMIVLSLGLFAVQWSLIQWAALAQLDYASVTMKKVLMLLLVWWLSPDVAVVLLLSIAGALLAMLVSSWSKSSVGEARRGFSALRSWLLAWPEVAVAWLTLGGLLYGILQMMLNPRYCTVAVPILYFLLAYYFLVIARHRWIGVSLFCLLLVFNVSNFYGQWLPSTERLAEKTHLHSRSSAWLERSLEYREAHRSDVKAARLLDEEHPDAVIVSWFPHSYYLRWPLLGYVTEPLDVRDLGSDLPSAHAEFMSIVQEANRTDPPREILLLTMENRAMNVPWPAEDDDLVYLDDCPARLAIYRLPEELRSNRTKLSDWYIEGVSRGITDPYLKIEFLASMGKRSEALTVVEELLKENAEDSRAQQLRAHLQSR